MKKIFDIHLTQQDYMNIAKGNYRLPFLVFTPLALLQTIYALHTFELKSLWIVLWFVVGFFTWGWIEYALHRFSFHWHVNHGLLKFITSGFHQLHHQVPQSQEFIVSPIYFGLLGQSIWQCAIYLISKDLALTLIMGSGIAVGYVYYEWVHFLCHHKTLKTKYYQRIKAAHLQHHFKTPKKNFGVSYPFWDYLFGTYVTPSTSLPQNLSQ